MQLLLALWKRKFLWVMQVAGNAVLLALVWVWLSLPEATVWQVAASVLLALAILLAALWLHGLTLAVFRMPYGPLPLLATARRLPSLLVWAVITLLVVLLALQFVPAAKAAWLPKAAAVLGFVFLLPLGSQVAGEGSRGFFRMAAWGPVTQWHYYAAAALAGLVGAALPYKLIWWIPGVEGLRGQAGSMAIRFLLAYLLAVTAWFVLLASVSRLSAKHGGRQSEAGL